MSDVRRYDIVLFGATGFTGRLTAEYLARKSAREPFRWALAGRNPGKLEELKKQLAGLAGSEGPDVIVADSDDPASLAGMARQTQVVITTVGPYAKYGEPLVEACITAGADYVDLTGEPAFVNRILQKYGSAAENAGVRIVNCCGFDSIPHDLGAYFTVRELNRRLGDQAGKVPVHIEGYVRFKGDFSGGTWHSAIGAFADAREAFKVPKTQHPKGRKIKLSAPKPGRVGELGGWSVPMPTIDPQMVRRSAEAFDMYGPEFKYGHNLIMRKLRTLATMGVGMGTVVALAQFKPTRDLLLKVRDPGEGPSEATRAKGRFSVTFLAQANSVRLRTEVSGGDPGYNETAKMLAESALTLAKNRDRLPPFKGIITPAMAMGDALIERLQFAGIDFKTLDGAAAV